jgi:hypothetical protein
LSQRARAAASVVAALFLLGGCTGAGSRPGTASSTNPPTPATNSPTTPASPPAYDASFEVPPLALFFRLFGGGRWVSYRCCLNNETVNVYDTRSRMDRVVFRSQGEADWIVGDANTVVWIDQASRQSDAEPKVDWVMYAQDLLTGQRRVLARAQHNLVPFAQAGAGHVVWAGDPIGGGNPAEVVSLHEWRIGDAEPPRVLVGKIHFGDGSESVTSRGLYFIGPAVTGPGSRGGDVYFLPWSGGAPSALTRTGLVAYVAASADGATVGFQQKDPHAQLDDPYTTWLLDHGTPRLIEDKLNNGNLVAGDGWLAWIDGADVKASIVDSGPITPFVLGTDLAPGSFLGADGGLLVYGSRDVSATDTTPTKAHVVTVRRPG